jgi:hypothetical protein
VRQSGRSLASSIARVNCVPERAAAEMLCVAADDARRDEILRIVAGEAEGSAGRGRR